VWQIPLIEPINGQNQGAIDTILLA